MSDTQNYGKTSLEKWNLLHKYSKLLTGRDKDYMWALREKGFLDLTPMEIYRVVEVYDTNHVAFEAAISKEEA